MSDEVAVIARITARPEAADEVEAAFDAHGQNPALREAFGRFGGDLAEPPELHVLTPVQAKHL